MLPVEPFVALCVCRITFSWHQSIVTFQLQGLFRGLCGKAPLYATAGLSIANIALCLTNLRH